MPMPVRPSDIGIRTLRLRAVPICITRQRGRKVWKCNRSAAFALPKHVLSY